MPSRLWAAIRRDNLITFRSQFYFIQLAIAGIYVVAVLFLVPDSVKLQPTLYVADETPGRHVADLVTTKKFTVPVAGKVRLVGSAAEVVDKTKHNENGVGLVVSGATAAPTTRFYFQGTEKERFKALLSAAVAERMSAQPGAPSGIGSDVLRKDNKPITFRRALVPFLLFVDFGAVGSLLAVTLIFAEKDEGILAAVRVTPGRTWEYLMAKAVSVTVLAIVVSVLVVALTIGRGVNYPGLIVMVGVGGWGSAMLGEALALRFRSFEEYFMPMVMLGQLLISLPAVVYLVPSFRPAWVLALPFTKFMFGLREAIFPSGNTSDLTTAVLAMGALGLVCLWIGAETFKRQLARA